MTTKAEAARLERIARIEEHRAAFYAECQAKYRPPGILRQALDTVPDTHLYLCGGCGVTFERALGGPVDCLACAAHDDAAKIEELTDKVASLEGDAKSVEDAKAEAQQHYERLNEVQKRLDKAIDLLQRAQGLLETIDSTDDSGLAGVVNAFAEPLAKAIDAFMVEGG